MKKLVLLFSGRKKIRNFRAINLVHALFIVGKNNKKGREKKMFSNFFEIFVRAMLFSAFTLMAFCHREEEK